MIYNKKNIFINRFIHYYVKWIVSRHFHELLFNTITVDKNKSILLIANHFSFWDGLILHLINEKLLKKKFHVMMQKDTTAALKYLKYAGAFSITKNSRDIIESLDYAAGLLNDPSNLVLIFPQGKLFSNYVTDVHFEKGVWRMIEKAKGNFQVIFAATFVQYFKHKKPAATVYLTNNADNFTRKNLAELKEAYQEYYSSSKLLQTEFDI